MAKVRCARGHFYLDDKDKECPQCRIEANSGANMMPGNINTTDSHFIGKGTVETSQKKPHIGWLHRGKNEVPNQMPNPMFNQMPNQVPNQMPNQMPNLMPNMQAPFSNEIPATLPLGMVPQGVGYQGNIPQPDVRENREELPVRMPEATPVLNENLPIQQPQPVHAPQQQGNIADALNSVKTVSIYATNGGSEPVTGWLVAVSGAYYGRSFELKTGQNFIGRDGSMDIVLAKEGSVSRDKHAIVLFEPKKKEFFVQNGGSSGLTYCNDELITLLTPLKAYDKIQVGDVDLLFIPFCGENYEWTAGGN